MGLEKISGFVTAALFALCLHSAAPASAENSQISSENIRNFIMRANTAMNSPNSGTGRSFLDSVIHERAAFDSRISYYPRAGLQNVAGRSFIATAYYRYPVNQKAVMVSNGSMGKEDFLAAYDNKRSMIYGYATNLEPATIRIYGDGTRAMVDVDFKEMSLNYAPHNANLLTRVIHAHSRCRMYLAKDEFGIMLQRMDCNTNSSMPY